MNQLRFALALCLLLTLGSCWDYCPGTPSDFEEGTEQQLPEKYDFHYAAYTDCWATLSLLNDTYQVHLAPYANQVVADTSYYDICEAGYEHFSETHRVVFKNNDEGLCLIAEVNSSFTNDINLSVKGLTSEPRLWFRNAIDDDFIGESARFLYRSYPNGRLDTLLNENTGETVVFRFSK